MPGQVSRDRLNAEGGLAHVCATHHGKIHAFLEQASADPTVQHTQELVRASLRILEDALSRYSLSELSFSYNGGKDCLVLLILYLGALHAQSQKTVGPLPPSLQSVYIVTPHPFKEAEDFVKSSQTSYRLDLTHYAKPMRDGFDDYLREKPHVKAIFVGTRRTDPFAGALKHFDPTDRGWPAFVRIHPVIDWHYANVWKFLRALHIPYCPLYDLGFTSLGSSLDTHPNPMLKRSDVADDASAVVQYRPAYELIRDDEERLGRDNRVV